MRTLGGQHLDDVTVLQRVIEGNHATVRLGPNATVTDLGVDAVGEVDRGGAGWQRQDVALGREDEDLVTEDVDLDGIDELLGIEDFLLPIHQLPQPGEPLVHLALVLAATLLIGPVGGHPPLGGTVHFVSADLNLHRLAAVADDGGVQRLVPVGLRHRDVVLEAPRDWLPERVDDPEGPVAVLDRIRQHPNGGEVVDLVEIFAQGELVGDAVDVLRPPTGVGLDADGRELALEDLLDVVDVGLALFALARDLLDDLLVFLGMELGKGEVFQLPLDVPHAEPVGQRRVDVQRLLGHGPAAVLR